MPGSIKAHMPGILQTLEVSEGASVAAGDVVAYIESMKMQIPVEAIEAGTVHRIALKAGDIVAEDDVIMTLR